MEQNATETIELKKMASKIRIIKTDLHTFVCLALTYDDGEVELIAVPYLELRVALLDAGFIKSKEN